MKPYALSLTALLVLSFYPVGGSASEADRIQALEAQLRQQQVIAEQQQRALEAMQAELQRLKAAQSPAAEAVVEMPAAPGHAIAGTAEKGDFTLYGHFQLDTIYDFKRVDPTWESTLRPSTIPTSDGAFGSDGNTVVSVKQTQGGFKYNFPSPLGQVKTWFEFDFFGTGSDAGDTKFNLRHAWAEVGGLGFGQTNSTFMDISIFPNVIDWWGPSGMAFNRNPQVRYTWRQPASSFALALEKPNGSFNTGVFGELSPEFDAAARAKTRFPDLTGHWRSERDWGHYQLAGVLRRLEFETQGSEGNRPNGTETGWGLNLTSVINTAERDQLKLGLVYGEGIASFMNDGGVNLAPHNNAEAAVPVLAVTAYYDRYWSQQWSSSIGFSLNQADTRNQQANQEFDSGRYASVNLLYTPYPELLIGSELLYGRHEDVGGRTGEDYRLQFTLKHKFNKLF